MKKLVIALTFVLFLLLTGCSQPDGIQVSDAWARPGLAEGTSAVYFKLVNGLDQADVLVGAASPAAANVEVHQTKMDANGNMSMSPAGNLDLQPGTTLTFEPGGTHVMLMGLQSTLQPGDEIELTLQFETAPDQTITVPVREP